MGGIQAQLFLNLRGYKCPPLGNRPNRLHQVFRSLLFPEVTAGPQPKGTLRVNTLPMPGINPRPDYDGSAQSRKGIQNPFGKRPILNPVTPSLPTIISIGSDPFALEITTAIIPEGKSNSLSCAKIEGNNRAANPEYQTLKQELRLSLLDKAIARDTPKTRQTYILPASTKRLPDPSVRWFDPAQKQSRGGSPSHKPGWCCPPGPPVFPHLSIGPASEREDLQKRN